jgi:ribonuclease-3
MAVYNPFNPKNRLFAKKDIALILEKHKCPFEIKDTELFQMAMVHSSYVKRTEYTSPTGESATLAPKPADCLALFDHSYERLEHLGDSILGACVSTYIMKRFPTENEGFMTDLKKEIVCNEMLGSLSQKIGLDKFYIISRHNEDICDGRKNSKKLGDILEAFIGALWLESNNFPNVYSFIICLVETYIDIPRILMNNRNFKEQLQKVYQSKYHTTPTYTVLSGSLTSYTVAVLGSDGRQMGTGTGPTKKQAEQLAAKDAISKIE